MSNTPKQYQQGWVEFYKLKFKVDERALIPRPETELLVDEVVRWISDHPERSRVSEADRRRVEGSPQFIILDLGTGAGNIAISIAKNAPNVKIIATDVSVEALKLARQNAKLHGVKKQILFFQSDLLTTLPLSLLPNPSQLIIVTNLPYIPSARIPYLDSSVKDFEPRVALDGGQDGFALYRKLFQQIKDKGWKPNLIVGEIDYTHGELAYDEAYQYFPKAQTEVQADLYHRQRILIIKQ